MTATTAVGALLVAAFDVFCGVVASALGWAPAALMLGLLALFFVLVALAYLVPVATDEILARGDR